MATYQSILTKTEDAFKVAFLAIAGDDMISGVTVYKQGEQTKLDPPYIVIEAVSSEPFVTDTNSACLRENHAVTLNVVCAVHGEDSDRNALANLAGLVENTMSRSADQIVSAMDAANVTDYTPFHYRYTGQSSSMFDDSVRAITNTAIIGGYSR